MPSSARPGLQQRSDRLFFLVFVLFAWTAVLMGFGPVVWKRYQGLAASPASAVLQIHVFAFVGWLTLLTMQVLLIRARRVALHRLLGFGMLFLLPVMVVAGMGAEIDSQRRSGGDNNEDLSFFVTPLIETILFTCLAVAAFVKRRDSPAHKRLIFLATSLILVAAFNRWWGEALDAWFGTGFWAPILSIFFGPNVLMACAMLYDVASRGSIHPVYRFAVPVIVAAEIAAGVIWHAAWWPGVARRMLGL